MDRLVTFIFYSLLEEITEQKWEGHLRWMVRGLNTSSEAAVGSEVGIPAISLGLDFLAKNLAYPLCICFCTKTNSILLWGLGGQDGSTGWLQLQKNCSSSTQPPAMQCLCPYLQWTVPSHFWGQLYASRKPQAIERETCMLRAYADLQPGAFFQFHRDQSHSRIGKDGPWAASKICRSGPKLCAVKDTSICCFSNMTDQPLLPPYSF